MSFIKTYPLCTGISARWAWPVQDSVAGCFQHQAYPPSPPMSLPLLLQGVEQHGQVQPGLILPGAWPLALEVANMKGM